MERFTCHDRASVVHQRSKTRHSPPIMSKSGSVEAQLFPIPTDDGERHANDMQHAVKPENISLKANRPTAPPTPPKDRSLSVDSGIALQEPQSPVTPPTDDDEQNELLREVIAQCSCAPNDVEDLYGCTPLQEAMVAQTMKEPSAYTIEHEFYLSPEIDPKRLQNAWDQTAQANPALRTRMITTRQRGCLQVVLRGPVPWQMECDDDTVPEETTVTVWKIGAPLVSFSCNTSQHILRIKIHHSICDGWSIGLLLKQTEAAFRGEDLTPRSFRPLVEYIDTTKAQTNAFWEAEFQGVDAYSMSIFPQVPIKGYTPTPSHRIERSWDIDGSPTSPGTVNSKLRLAWAILQSIYTGCNNVLFGAVSTGRGVPVEGIQEMAGPTIASVPVLIKLDPNSTVGDAVSTIQTNWGASMPFEHIGLQNLLHLSPGAKAACEFQTLISVEPQGDDQGPRLFSNGKSTQTAYGLFALIIRCCPTSQGIWIELAFDPGVMDARQGERVLSQLAHIYNQVEKYPSCLLSEVDCISPEDSTELSHMALTGLSSETPQCVHELFQRRVAEQPQAPAISSWDGDLSFEALDNISTALAEHLRRHVSREEFVPLCIGKSKWVAIAMLAVMKAGGAFVLLDTMHPIPRLQQMCQTAKANLLICSRQQLDTTIQLDIPNTIIVDDLQLDGSFVTVSPLSSVATPDDPIYATFTSGSTGVPKCVIVHHAGYASSSLAHGGPYRFTPEARVLQFASPAFDSCIIEHLSTLVMGGCVCIPSADDCHSNLGDSIQKFGVTVACLTPTVTRIINPEDLPTLDVIVFVGEAVLVRDVERWQPHVQTVGNAYGPAECSAVFSVQPEVKYHDPSNIGFPTGGIGWVVHPNDHNRLMPMGCTGELLIEGLIVGKGYLSNPDQTAKAFIESPEWRRQLQPAPTGRLYKTGDLVEYAGDGSFRYHGRKDTQAKIHGQRLELGEIEHHLRNAFAVEHVVAELIRSSPEDAGTDHRPDVFLTAFVHHQENDSTNTAREEGVILPPSDSFRTACANAEAELSDSLPQFMVPDVFLPLSYVPLTPSGKTNRRFLRDQVGDLSWTAMQKYRATDTEPELPSTAQEDSLRTIWAETLNRPIADIGVDDSFFRLGGDSVSAMQMAASCQAAGFNIVVADVFRCPSIRKLSEKIQKACGLIPLAAGLGDTQTETRFDLSPIQQFFFERVPDGHDSFTMEFLVRIAKPLMEAQVEEAILALSGRHAMLRARFEKDSNGCWGQVIGESLQKGVCFRSHWLHSIHDYKDLKNILVGGRELLRPAEGTQMVADLLNAKEGQFLSLVAHHAVIDLVSWRVLLQDLEDILTTGRPLQPTSTSFQQWCKLQRAHIRDEMHLPEPLASHPPPKGYWGSSAIYTENIWDRAIRSTVTVGRDATQGILGKSNDSFHTRPVELVQAAVLYSFVQVFDDRQAPTIFTEGHGREPWDARIDIARTVGWFTTIAPLFLDVNKEHDIFRLLELTKDGRRRLLSHGFSSFSRRYLRREDRRSEQDDLPMEILFNYTGLFQQLERPGALLQFAQLPSDSLLSMPGDLPRFALIDINAVVMDGYLTLNFIHNSHMKSQTRIMQWIDKCRETLEALPHMLQQEQRLTVSDLPLLSFAEESQLRDLLHNISSRFDVPRSKIEDIYPCTPLQLGIYISQLKDPQAYWSHLRWSVPRPAQGQDGPVDLERVKLAWQKVVEHNPILRTVLIENTAYPREPVQVVLQSTDASIRVEEQFAVTDDGDLPGLPECFHLYHRSPTDRGLPPHLLQITSRPDGNAFCQLTIHHILVDGATEQIFLADFDRAYRGVLDEAPAEKLASYVNYLAGCDLEGSKRYWKDYLKNLAPCIFPSLDVSLQTTPKKMPQILPFNFEIGQELHDFCRQNGMTVSSFLQVAWGLVLRTYTGSESVCFGYLHSCRDLPIVHANCIAGPMVNILVCQLSLNKDTMALETLLANHEAYANSIEHQHCSLAEMVHSLQLSGKSLFNTVMSIQKDVLTPDSEGSFEGAVKPEEGVDATEYDLTVNIATSQSRIRGDLTYWAHLHSHSQVEMIADAFHSSIMQLLRSSHSPVDSLTIAGNGNMDQILRLNESLPESTESCIHTGIIRSTLDYPEAVAVCAWDGDFTYRELKERANAVAKELALRSVGPGTFVPILSEKSKWEPVSILAVLEAGGAFILLDPAQPQDRLQSMIHDDFHCPLIISSLQQAELAASIVPDVIVAESVEPGVEVDYEVLGFNFASVSAQSACYAVFSSGSTGKPKASVIEHRSYLSAAHHHSKVMELNAQSRVLHFASNAFDAAILEIMSTLLAGGCVCIPSDDERNNKLEASIAKYEVTWSLLTPSVSRVLDPQAVPTLKTLVFGGERMSLDDIRRWSPYVACMNAYGPSEASVVSTCQPSSQRLLDDPSNIGHPTGAVAWALNSHPPHHPVPLGAIGELAVEGPIVGRGYVNRPDNMKKSFLPYPEWLRRIRNTPTGVLYKTGDLVRMMPDGSITYLGRRDNQVKLHGQRIELAEVEHQVQRCYPAANPEVFADLVTPGASQTPYLVASITVSQHIDAASFKKAADETKARLRSDVPSFLVPSFLLAAEEVPRLVNGKVDRQKLQQAASRMVEIEISQSLACHSSRLSVQLTPEQRLLQRLWADVLNRPSSSIFPEDDFFAIGGDSVAAMKLSSSTASEGLDISVSDIFLHSTLEGLAHVAVARQSPLSSPTNKLPHDNQREAFSLLRSGHNEEILSQAMSQCCVPREQIQDVYPCTELQVGLAALTAQRQGASVARHRFQLEPGIDLNRLRKAWQTVMARNDILRTRLMISDMGYLQVLLKEDELLWVTANEHSSDRLQWELIFGQPLAQFEVIPSSTDQECETIQFDLVLTMHHAIYDAWSLSVLVEKATLAYHDQYTPNMDAVPFRDFIAYSISQEEPSLEYWSKQLRELKADQFPQLPSPSYRSKPSTQIERTFHTGPLMDAWVNRTAAIRLSWALVQSQYQNSDDIVFGVISNGRTAPVQGIEAMVGPTIATYPLRVQVNRNLKGSQAIANIHEQSMEIASFEQIGLSKIAALGTDGARACAFQVLLMELRANGDHDGQAVGSLMQSFGTSSADEGSYTYAVQLAVMMKPEAVSVAACFDPNVVSEWQMSRMLDQFGHILQQVHVDLDRSVHNITTINQNDIQQLQIWHPEILDPGTRTVVDCIRQQCITQPSAPAISSSIGDMSYEELEMRSDAVADRLVANGAGPGTFIPICLERSQCVPVAVLGVLKTGAAFVLLDAELPLERLRTMCAYISASLVISSITTQAKASRLGAEVVTLVPEKALPYLGRRYELTFGPDQPLYVSFTSGSTGAPKGVVVNNNAFMATAMGHSRVSGLSPQSRVLQFASYAFDVSILELLPTLMAGGCLCIPPESERRDQLAETITALRTNLAMLTPSVLRTMDPTAAIPLETVITGGESLRPSDIQQWAPYVSLLTGYGPAEAAVTFTMSSCIRDTSQATNIGSPVAGAIHVVDPRDPERLVPIGAIGELLLQGPQVSHGYLNNAEKTKTTFIAPPRWLREVQQQDSYDCETPMYCTGDLVRYGQDGSLWFMGRKDNQAKLRGQRMELGEIEEQIKRAMLGVKDVVAEVITPSSTSDSPWLAAFVTLVEPGPESSSTGIIPLLDVILPSSFAETIAAVFRQLESLLPSYMVPSLVIPLRRMLHTPSGKVDRRSLREAIATIPRHEVDRHLAPEAIDKQAPSTEAECLLRDIWARVLRVAADEIGVDDSFFRLGGDSISAVRATADARSSGVKHSVGELLQWQTISLVAERSAHISTREHSWTIPVPFSLVSDSEKTSVLSSMLSKTRSFTPDDVEDIIPAAALQTFYITHSSPVSMTQSFKAHFDIGRFRKACARLAAQHSILRTVFVGHNDKLFQVILKEADPSIELIECADPEQWVQAKSKEPLPAATAEFSSPLAFTVVASSTQQQWMLIIQISHAQYDGLSVPVLWEDLITAYQDGELKESGQFKDVVSYRLDAENPSLPFWRDHLQGAPASAIDPLQLTGMSQPSMNDISVELTISQPPLLSGITLSTLVRAALAWVLAQQAETSDIILGQVVHGRGGSLPHIDRTLGPCLNQLPLRVMLNAEWTVEDLLRDVQDRQVEIVANDNVSFEQIVRNCTSWPEGSGFGCFVHHQGLAMSETAAVMEIGGIKSSSGPSWAASRMAAGQVGVVSIEHESCLGVRITAAENTLDQSSVNYLGKRVVDAIELFAGSPSSSLSSLA